MRNKFLFLIFLLGFITIKANGNEESGADSTLAKTIDREAQAEDFIHAYLLMISEGEPYYSTFGHTAIRLVCPSKKLDYCFTFEMNLKESSWLDIARRKVEAGFASVPSDVFIKMYASEGRGITAYELNLSPKEKQNLWKVLDHECANGRTWNFDGISINCTSMALYAINKAIEPAEVKFKKLPQVVYDDLGVWTDYTTRQSPWIRIGIHIILHDVDDKETKPEDLLTPAMMKTIMPYVVITDEHGNHRTFTKGKPTNVLPQKYTDKPYWLTPTKALLCLLIVAVLAVVIIYNRKKLKH